MNLAQVSAIANAVLYEGYILYPYRPSALKNQQRWTFGGIFPEAYKASGEPFSSQTQCLVRGNGNSVISARARFFHMIRRDSPWDEAVEREIIAPRLPLSQLTRYAMRTPIRIPATAESDELTGYMELSATEVAQDLFRLTVRLRNTTPLANVSALARDVAQRSAFASAHSILFMENGAFISLTDPPPELAPAVRECENEGNWPVLVGQEGQADMLLCSPIILPDYPQIAPESPGDLFDGCEIDEILTLRILTMTDAEKREMAAADPRTRALLERTQSLTEAQMGALHGALRRPRGEKPELVSLDLGGIRVSVGDKVRLKPKGRADIMDVVLSGMLAQVEAIERDFENKVHVAVTVDGDPGSDLGMERMPGHRFFFSTEEIEPVRKEHAA